MSYTLDEIYAIAHSSVIDECHMTNTTLFRMQKYGQINKRHNTIDVKEVSVTNNEQPQDLNKKDIKVIQRKICDLANKMSFQNYLKIADKMEVFMTNEQISKYIIIQLFIESIRSETFILSFAKLFERLSAKGNFKKCFTEILNNKLRFLENTLINKTKNVIVDELRGDDLEALSIHKEQITTIYLLISELHKFKVISNKLLMSYARTLIKLIKTSQDDNTILTSYTNSLYTMLLKCSNRTIYRRFKKDILAFTKDKKRLSNKSRFNMMEIMEKYE